MGRANKARKARRSELGGEIKDVVISKGMTVIVVLIFLLVASMLVKAFLQESNYFKLRAVDIKASFLDPRASTYICNQVYNTYKGRNVFSINLKYIAQYIQKSYGDVRDVVVRIAPPDKLVISLKLRKPVALVKGGKFYPIDEEGVVLPGGSRVDALNDLPVISGVDMTARGSRAAYRNLMLALELLQEIRQTRSLANFGVTAISVYDPSNLIFYLKNGIEIRVGAENFRERLDLLTRALRDPRLVTENIKYIDVRFKDVIIGPK
jgi:cell division septal protein FtsQ